MDTISYSLAAKANKRVGVVEGQILTPVPVDAVFTDTVYDDSTTTKQGNVFNGVSQLVQTDVNGKLPAVDGSNLLGVSSGTAITNVEFTATSGQTTFTTGYTVDMIDVLVNGTELGSADFTANNGTTVVLAIAASLNDLVVVKKYASFDVANTYTKAEVDTATSAVRIMTEFTATASQTTFTINYTVGRITVYRNGLKLSSADVTASNGTSVVLAPTTEGDLVTVEKFGMINVADTYTIAEANGLLADKVDNSQVLTNVPAGALFTDTDTAYPSDALVAQDITDVQNLSGTNTGDQDLSGYSLIANTYTKTEVDNTFAAINTDPTLNNFTRATATGDTFSVQYAKTSPGAGVVSLYKEVASVDETSNVFSATAVGNAFEYDNTKLDFVGGNLGLKVVGTAGYGLANASYDSVSFSVAAQDTNPYGIGFSADGAKMYMLGYANDTVYQYTLATAWDISTASYDTVSFSVATEDASPVGIAFSVDGTKMYILGITNDSVYQYTTGGTPTYTALASNLNEAVILHTTDANVTPEYSKTAIIYDANATYRLLAPVTDYTVKLGTDQATITSKVAGNIKGRIV
jgi:hypothetical protein